MKDEIASFKVTAADIQKQSVHPSGDRHTQRDVAILYLYTVCTSSGVGLYVQYILQKYRLHKYIYTRTHIYIHICIERYTNIHIYPHVDTESYFIFIETYASKSFFYSRTWSDVNYNLKIDKAQKISLKM